MEIVIVSLRNIHEEKISELKNDSGNKKNELQEKIYALDKSIENKKREMESLGLLKLGRKKELLKNIENENAQIDNLREKMIETDRILEEDIKAAEKKLADTIALEEKKIKAKYLIGKSPKEIYQEEKDAEEREKRKKEKIERWNNLGSREKYEKMEVEILKIINEELMTASDILEKIEKNMEIPMDNFRVSSVLKQMTEQQKVLKTVNNRKSYFSKVI